MVCRGSCDSFRELAGLSRLYIWPISERIAGTTELTNVRGQPTLRQHTPATPRRFGFQHVFHEANKEQLWPLPSRPPFHRRLVTPRAERKHRSLTGSVVGLGAWDLAQAGIPGRAQSRIRPAPTPFLAAAGLSGSDTGWE
jgi:hypothetical protein